MYNHVPTVPNVHVLETLYIYNCLNCKHGAAPAVAREKISFIRTGLSVSTAASRRSHLGFLLTCADSWSGAWPLARNHLDHCTSIESILYHSLLQQVGIWRTKKRLPLKPLLSYILCPIGQQLVVAGWVVISAYAGALIKSHWKNNGSMWMFHQVCTLQPLTVTWKAVWHQPRFRNMGNPMFSKSTMTWICFRSLEHKSKTKVMTAKSAIQPQFSGTGRT